MIGFVIGLLRFGLEFAYTIPPCGSLDPEPRPDFVKTWVGYFHYLHFGTFLFFFNVLVAMVVSILTEPIPEEKVSILFFLKVLFINYGYMFLAFFDPILPC